MATRSKGFRPAINYFASGKGSRGIVQEVPLRGCVGVAVEVGGLRMAIEERAGKLCLIPNDDVKLYFGGDGRGNWTLRLEKR